MSSGQTPEPDTGPPKLLSRILQARRAHGSEPDKSFRLWLFNYIRADLKLKPQIKEEGCIYVETDPKSTVLFSCHVDTVHSIEESNRCPTQRLLYDPAFGHLFLEKESNATCLGGDDGVGIYLMLEMLKRGIKGRYIFHTGEERGGIGSRAFVKANKVSLQDIEQVVAFDRAVRSGESPEVIYVQGGTHCASIEYATQLAKELSAAADFEKPYVISTRGSFTDSKVYSEDVPECVNIGCFYENQHTAREVVDTVGVGHLLEAVCKLDWTKLPIRRKLPSPEKTYNGGHGAYKGYNGFRDYDDSYDTDGINMPAEKTSQSKPQPKQHQARQPLLKELESYDHQDMVDFVETAEPEQVAFALFTAISRMGSAEATLARFHHYMGVS